MPRPKTYVDADRDRILERAAQVIAHDGVAALSLRGLAGDCGVSTTAVYTLIGGKDEIVAETARAARRSFTAAQNEAVGGVNAEQDLAQLGLAYRGWAIARPSLYAVLFRGLVPEPSPEDDQGNEDGFGPLLGVVSRLAEEGRLFGDDARAASLAIWAAVHGAVSLELELWPQQDETVSAAAFEIVLDAVTRAWLV